MDNIIFNTNKVDLIDSDSNNKSIKIVCISDTHTKTDNLELPKGDILIHSGDFTFGGLKKEVIKFNKFLQKQDFKYKIVIAGNHELTFDEKYNSCPDNWRSKEESLSCTKIKELITDCIYLENSGINIMGYNVWGSPYTPKFCNWAFMRERGSDIKQIWDLIPKNTDILITHGPPYGILDECDKLYNHGKIVHAGCEELLTAVTERVKPKYHIFGHIHEQYGILSLNETTFINASICNLRYKPDNKPIVIELSRK